MEWSDYLAERFGLRREAMADRVVMALLCDVTDRRGWRHEWDGFDEDVQAEIVATWRAKAEAAIGAAS